MSQPVTFRPIRDDDYEFLYRVYASTREEELQQTSWDDAQKEQFLRFQFTAQGQYYQQHFTDARFEVILLAEHPVGRLYVDRRADEIRVIDIALLPEHRGAGIGGGIMHDLLAEATESGKPVRLHVEHHNRAVRLYERMGFTTIGEHGIYSLMEWRPHAG